MEDKRKKLGLLEKYRIPALVLVLGLILLLLPGFSGKKTEPDSPELKLQELLCQTRGVGESRVLISENGVVVVCAGAEDPRVRLDMIRAIGSYTGFGSDKITVLTMADQS